MTVNILLTIFVSLFMVCLFQKQIELVFLSLAIVWLILQRQYPIYKNLKLYGKLFGISVVFMGMYIWKMGHEVGCLESVGWKKAGCFWILLIGVILIGVVIDMACRITVKESRGQP